VQPYSPQIAGLFSAWQQIGEQLMAPSLLEYEVTSALRRAVTLGISDQQLAEKTLRLTSGMGIELVPPSLELDISALYWADRIDQSQAHDTQYLALASRENAPLWTADRRLVNAARDAGFLWIRWIED
jgi:predicted nucleic acid-binding protein